MTVRTPLVIVAAIAPLLLANTADSQGVVPHPGTTPAITPVVTPGPGGPFVPIWEDPWGRAWCEPLPSCNMMGNNPCVIGGGCAANSDAFGTALLATWCDQSYVQGECRGGASVFVDCEQTVNHESSCGAQWTADCLCNGLLGPMVITGTCQRTMCRWQ